MQARCGEMWGDMGRCGEMWHALLPPLEGLGEHLDVLGVLGMLLGIFLGMHLGILGMLSGGT